MGWSDRDADFDDDTTIRPAALRADHAGDHALAGCLWSLLFTAPLLLLLGSGLFAAGWLLAGLRFP